MAARDIMGPGFASFFMQSSSAPSSSSDDSDSDLDNMDLESSVSESPTPTPVPTPSPKSNKKIWTSHDTLLMICVVHMIGGVEDPSQVDWALVRKRLHVCRSVSKMKRKTSLTSKECKKQYCNMMQLAQDNLEEHDSPAFLKREFIIKTIAHGLFCAARSREQSLVTNIQDLATSFNTPEPDENDSDESDEEIPIDETNMPHTAELFTVDDSFLEEFSSCFAVQNTIVDGLKMPSLEFAEQYLKRFSADPAVGTNSERGHAASVSPVLIVVDKDEADIRGNCKTMLPDGENFSTDMNMRTQPDVSRNVTTVGAPTLSKLLELPPRDRNQPLPQINSLASETSKRAEVFIPTISPLEQQDSSTKLLAALGTTTTTVKISQFPAGGSDNLPFAFRLSESPLKAMDEIEIANDYVMESGLISCENIETTKVDEPTVSESFVVPSSTIMPNIETDSKTQTDASDGGPEVKNVNDPSKIERKEELLITPESDALEGSSGMNESPALQKLSVDTDKSTGTVRRDSTCLENTMNMETPAEVGNQSFTRDKPPTDISTTPNKSNEAGNSRFNDNNETSHERKSRGTKRETPELPSTPVTRHTAKEKWKAGDSDEKQTRDYPPATPTSSRRLASRSAGQSEDNKHDEVPQLVGKTAQRRLFAARPTTPDIHAPNLRSRRIPTPTPGASPLEEDSKTSNKRSKMPTDEKETKETGKMNESLPHHEDVPGASNSNVTLVKPVVACESGKAEDAAVDRKDKDGPVKLLDKSDGVSQKLVVAGTSIKGNESGDAVDDENSNSGTDTSVKKRLTRRSVKIVNVPSSKDTTAGDGENKDDSVNKETKTRNSKILARVTSVSEESADKEEQTDAKRITRARAKTSVTPSRIRTKSTGSSKTPGKNDGDTETSESGEPVPSRSTRSRQGVSSGPSAATTTESVPASLGSNPCSPGTSTVAKEEEIKDMKLWKKSMIALVNRIGQHPHASIFNIPSGSEEILNYKKKIKRPMDLSIIKKNIESGVIKTSAQLRRDLNLMFMNLVMYNHIPGMVDTTVAGMNSAVATYCRELLEEFKAGQKLAYVAPEGTKIDASDVELEPTEEIKPKPTVTEKSSGRKRRNRSISTANSEEAQESKRRTLRTSTAAATTATSAWQSARQKKNPSTSDTSTPGRGRQHE